VSESKEITLIETGLASMDKVAAGIAELSKLYKGVIYDVTKPEEMEAAREARRAIKAPRVEVEKIRKAAKAPLLEIGRKLDGEAARITKELEALEEPIDLQIRKEEARVEAERQAKIKAEQERVAGIQTRIRGFWTAAEMATRTNLTAAQLSNHIADLEAIEIDESFAEFNGNAEIEKAGALKKLGEMRGAARDREIEAERVATEREALAKQRAEQEAANQAERNRIAAEEAAAKTRRDAEEAESKARRAEEDRVAREAQEKVAAAQRAEAARLKAERERLEAEEAARKADEKRRAEEAEAERLRSEREAQEKVAAAQRAEAARLKAERERLEAEEAARKADEKRRAEEAEAERLRAEREAFVPTLDDVIAVLSKHYGVTESRAAEWVGQLRLELTPAA
jgi:colicin import membrane protein